MSWFSSKRISQVGGREGGMEGELEDMVEEASSSKLGVVG